MKRILLMLLVLLCALSLTGCIDYGAMLTSELEAEVDQAEATPAPPLSEPLIEDRAGFFSHYNQVSLSDTLSDLNARFPDAEVTPAQVDETHNFVFSDGFGFTVVFGEGGAMLAKVPYYVDIRQLQPIAPGKNLDQVTLLTTGQTYSTIAAVFGGKGLEIMQMPPETEGAEGVRRLYVWMDDTGVTAEVLFDENGAYVSANLGTFSEN